MLRRRMAVMVAMVAVFGLGVEAAFAQAGGSQIFADGFESGDTAAWTLAREKAPGTLEVNAAAALGGSNFGLEVNTDGRAWVQDASPRREKLYQAQFLLDVNTLEMSRGARLELFRLYGKRNRHHTKLALQQVGPDRFIVHLLVRPNRGPYERVGGGEIVRGAETQITVQWTAGTTDLGGPNGSVRLLIDGRPAAGSDNVESERLDVRRARLGLTVGRHALAATGSYYLDDFQSFRTLAP